MRMQVQVQARTMTTARVAGLGLAAAGVLLLVASVIFPADFGADDYRDLVATVLDDARWRPANWLFLCGMLATTFAGWTLLESERVRADAWATALTRAATVSAALLSAGMAAFVAAYSERFAYAAGERTPLFGLAETIDTVGWPVFGVSIGLLAIIAGRDWRLTPAWAGYLAGVGGLGIGLAGFLGAGLHQLAGTWLNGLGLLVWLWMIWAGLRLWRETQGGE